MSRAAKQSGQLLLTTGNNSTTLAVVRRMAAYGASWAFERGPATRPFTTTAAVRRLS
jgi:hypothetical protein